MDENTLWFFNKVRKGSTFSEYSTPHGFGNVLNGSIFQKKCKIL